MVLVCRYGTRFHRMRERLAIFRGRHAMPCQDGCRRGDTCRHATSLGPCVPYIYIVFYRYLYQCPAIPLRHVCCFPCGLLLSACLLVLPFLSECLPATEKSESIIRPAAVAVTAIDDNSNGCTAILPSHILLRMPRNLSPTPNPNPNPTPTPCSFLAKIQCRSFPDAREGK